MEQRKLILIFISLFSLFSFLPIKESFAREADFPLEEDLSEQTILSLYLNVNPVEKKVYLKRIEAKYGFVPENQTSTKEIIEVVKNGKTLYQSAFQIDTRIDIFPGQGESPRSSINPNFQPREELVIVPYIKESDIFIKDRQTDKIYLSINNQKVESYNPQEKLRKDYEDKKVSKEDGVITYQGDVPTLETISPLNIFKIEVEKKKETAKKSFFTSITDRLRNWSNQIFKYLKGLFTKEQNPLQGKVKGVSSTEPQNLYLLFVSQGWEKNSSFGNDKETYYAIAVSMIKEFLSISPFDEFKNQINSFVVFTPDINSLNKALVYYPHHLLITIHKGIGQSYTIFGSGVHLFTGDKNNARIIAHEIGHAFAGLLDEYTYAPYTSDSPLGINCSSYLSGDKNSGNCEKWPGHTCYSGCTHESWGRYEDNCLMRDYSSPFCEICQNQIRSVFSGTKMTLPESQTTAPLKTPAPIIPTSALLPTKTISPTFSFLLSPTLTKTLTPAIQPTGIPTSVKPLLTATPTISLKTLTPLVSPVPTLAAEILSCSGGCYSSWQNCQTNCGRPCLKLSDEKMQEMCRWPSGYVAYRCCSTSTPIPTLSLTYTGQCNFAKIYDHNWLIIHPPFGKDQEVYLATKGTTNSPVSNTKARFRINGSASSNFCSGNGLTLANNWCETNLKHNDEFYIPHTFNNAGRFLIESMIFNINVGWY